MNPDELMTEVIIAILENNTFIKALSPMPDMADDGEELPDTCILVRSAYVGSELRILRSYSVTVSLDRAFRSEDMDQSEFETMWGRILTQFDTWSAFFGSLPIAAKVDHLTIDDIDGSGEPEAANQRLRRSLTLSAWLGAK